MSGLFALLSQSANGLQATQAWTSTIAQNLSNADNPAYARQRAQVAAAPPERVGDTWLGTGVVLAGVTQVRDRFVEAQFSLSTGQASASATQTQVLQSLSVFDTGSGGVATALSDFYAKLRALSQDPGSASYRQATVGSAQQLALAFNRTGTALASARTAVDEQIQGILPEINQTAAQIAQLNGQIHAAGSSGSSPNDLLDTRQKLADRLAELTGATPVASADGALNLVMPGGTALVVGTGAATLSAVADTTNAGHVAIYASPTDGSTAAPVGSAIGGQLGGLLAARDGALKTAESSIDQLAFDFADAMNTVHQAGYGLDGGTGRPLFGTTATAAGAAVGLTVDAGIVADPSRLAAASSAATLPGDATNLQAMIDTERQALSAGTNPGDTVAHITAAYGSAARTAEASHEADAAILSNVTALRASVSGVSTDEELVEMQKAQRAYEALAKVITTANAMLDTLMSLK